MDLFSLTIPKLRKLLDTKGISALELTERCLERIAQFDPQIHAFRTVAVDVARSQAARADERIADGESRPLLGIPYTMKDIFCTKDIETTASSNVLQGYVPAYNATVYTRLQEAGAVLLGKTNCDAWGHGSSTENSDFGPTKNPWNLDYVPGGSSGGSAAAVAAGFGFFSIAGDTGGSIRQPACFCNLSGMKVTYGRVSRYGSIAYASSLDTVGPLAKTAQECEIVLREIAGKDPHDATSLPDEYIGSEHYSDHKFTIGLPKEFYTEGLDPEVRKSVFDAVEVLKSLGAVVKNIRIPSTIYGVASYYLIAPSETSSNLARFDGVRYGHDRTAFGSEAKRRIMIGTLALSPEIYEETYHKAMRVRSVLKKEFEDALKEVDVILGPVSPTPPFQFGAMMNDPLAMFLGDVYTVLVNPTGCPSLAIPSGFTKNHLPIGMQLIGNMKSEGLLFALAKKYQEHTNWHTQHPTLV